MNDKKTSIVIVGSGTAGLISAIMLRKAFPKSNITLVGSSEIGIIGVGEGSTEHWREFMDRCDIPNLEMILETDATHKYGIKFENWSEAHPDYFHSISGVDDNIYAWNMYPVYMGLIDKNKLLTDATGSVGLRHNMIKRQNMHMNTNQFHFDTFKLNAYFENICFKRMIRLIDDTVTNVNVDSESGEIKSIDLKSGINLEADFWIDATGFKRVLSSALDNTKWNSFSKYLLMDSAFAFPTEADPSGEIRPYTRARAISSGWVWEIPTQQRRGNGCVYSSAFLTEEQAIKETSDLIGQEFTPLRKFTFDAGYLETPWVKNCCAMGLASAFVEPLEATSIGSTIQSVKMLIPFIAAYKTGNTASQKSFNKSFNIMMDNILTMVRLHYISDRRDTEFWRAMAEMPVNDSLQELLDLWQEIILPRNYIPTNDGQMFQIAHLLHVAQGQNVLNTESISRTLSNFDIVEQTNNEIWKVKESTISVDLVDHAYALLEISNSEESL